MPADNEKTPESIENKLTAIILPDPVGLHLDDVVLDDEVVILSVTSMQAEAHCPVCGQPSARVHSSYVRHPSDLALTGHLLFQDFLLHLSFELGCVVFAHDRYRTLTSAISLSSFCHPLY